MRSLSRRELLLASGAAALATVGRRPMLEGLGWLRDSWEMARPDGIVVHHSATEPRRQPLVHAAEIDADHRRKGMFAFYRGRVYHIAYHYVILTDGTLEAGRPEGCRGSHTRSLLHNYWTGICLVGYFDPSWRNPYYHRLTPAQMKTLVELSRDLIGRHRFPPSHILPHREVNPTLCPGRSFPWDEYRAAVIRPTPSASASARAAETSLRDCRTPRQCPAPAFGAAPQGDATAAAGRPGGGSNEGKEGKMVIATKVAPTRSVLLG